MLENKENLCLEGGGVKGYAYIGALKELEKHGILQNIKRFSGASVGAIFASLLSLDYSSEDIENCILNINLEPLELGWMKIFYLVKFFFKHGIKRLDSARDIIIGLLQYKNIPIDITLQEVYEKTGKELIIVTSNIERQRPLYLYHKTNPNVLLLDAIIASMSIPVYFELEKFNFNGYNEYYADGGMVDNYPIWVFNNLDELNDISEWTILNDSVCDKTLGLKLLEPNTQNNASILTNSIPITSLASLVKALLNTMMSQIERLYITESYIKNTIPIKIDNISFVDFDLDKKEINHLINEGSKSVQQYLKTYKI